jgi:mRNA-degrading endonuclease RelE of RelBE toxin-antitoxin system
MGFQLLQTKRFSRAYKKLHDIVASDVNIAVEEISDKPSIGEKKKVDLGDMFVFKFRSQNQHYLLGYTVKDSVELIFLEAIGPHENFYRDLKK